MLSPVLICQELIMLPHFTVLLFRFMNRLQTAFLGDNSSNPKGIYVFWIDLLEDRKGLITVQLYLMSRRAMISSFLGKNYSALSKIVLVANT